MPAVKQSSNRKRKPNKKAVNAKLANARAAKQVLKIDSTNTQQDHSGTPEQQSTPSASVPTEKVSASKRKLSYLERNPVNFPEAAAELPTTLAHLETLQHLFTGTVCKVCLKGSIRLRQDLPMSKGLAVGLISECKECGAVCGRTNTSRKSTSQSYEVNKALVAASLSIGVGHGSLTRFSEVLGMPPVHAKTYQSYVRTTHKSAKETALLITGQARDIVRELYEPDEGGIVNVVVSYDGTWHKRGHTSNHGAAVVICAVTGLVLDSHVMSLYCQLCKVTGKKLKAEAPADYAKWWESHQENCHQNYSGSSGGMEAEAAKVMWGRSLSFKMRYTTLIGDGDSKTFNAIRDSKFYGDVEVQKAECVNHVAKRLGTALRNLVNTEKKRGTTLGGRGNGTLTQDKIGKLQSYYTKAVRSHNSSVEEMRKAVWAAFYHSTSTDAEPQHHFCPQAPDSWCFYQRAISQGQLPGSHVGRVHTYLKPPVAQHVKKVYERLTDSTLMEKCLPGLTQNPNESIHAQIWLRCPKHIFVTRPRVEVATSLAIAEWNQGSCGTRLFLDHLGLSVSSSTISSGIKRDRIRVRKAQCAIQQAAKRRRQTQKTAAQRENERREEQEPHPYEPGEGAY